MAPFLLTDVDVIPHGFEGGACVLHTSSVSTAIFSVTADAGMEVIPHPKKSHEHWSVVTGDRAAAIQEPVLGLLGVTSR